MDDESAVSSRYRVEPSLSSPCSGMSSRSESKMVVDRELLPLRTTNLGKRIGTLTNSNEELRTNKGDVVVNREDEENVKFSHGKKRVAALSSLY